MIIDALLINIINIVQSNQLIQLEGNLYQPDPVNKR